LERAHTYRKVCRTVARKNIFEAREKMGREAFFGLDVDQQTNKNPRKTLFFGVKTNTKMRADRRSRSVDG